MFKLDQLFRFLFCLAIVLLFLAVSGKHEHSKLIDNPNDFLSSDSPINALHQIKKNGQEALCFTFSYPVWVVFPQGEEKSVRSDEELFALLDKWENEHIHKKQYPTLRMPFLLLPDQFGYTFVRTEEKFGKFINDCESVERNKN